MGFSKGMWISNLLLLQYVNVIEATPLHNRAHLCPIPITYVELCPSIPWWRLSCWNADNFINYSCIVAISVQLRSFELPLWPATLQQWCPFLFSPRPLSGHTQERDKQSYRHTDRISHSSSSALQAVKSVCSSQLLLGSVNQSTSSKGGIVKHRQCVTAFTIWDSVSHQTSMSVFIQRGAWCKSGFSSSAKRLMSSFFCVTG